MYTLTLRLQSTPPDRDRVCREYEENFGRPFSLDGTVYCCEERFYVD